MYYALTNSIIYLKLDIYTVMTDAFLNVKR